jgi:prepilin-type N-terminal cleavage/methylation domain-containing protein
MIARNNQKGFTLLELVLVIIIAGVLVAAAVTRYVSLAKDAERAVFVNEIGILSTAFSTYSMQQLTGNQTITANDFFINRNFYFSNYAGAFGDIDGNNCPAGYWAYQIGNASNGNWAVVVYRPKATLTQAFTWGGMQWIIYTVNEDIDASGKTIGLTLSEYAHPPHIW